MIALISNYSNGWEAAFVGAFQGGFIFLCIIVYRHFRKKRDAKKEKEEVEKEKLSSFIEERVTPHKNTESDASRGNSMFSKNYLQTVYTEMKEKCNPQCFMDPYSHEKVRIANEIYSSLLAMAEPEENELMALRHRAIEELGLVFDTKAIYEHLSSICNPSNFMHPYDAEKVNNANDIYEKIQQHKQSIEQLEQIRNEAMALGFISKNEHSTTQREQLVSILGTWETSEPNTIIRIILIKSDKYQYFVEKQFGNQWERGAELVQSGNSPWGVSFEFYKLDCHDIRYQIKSRGGDLVKYDSITHKDYAVTETFKKI